MVYLVSIAKIKALADQHVEICAFIVSSPEPSGSQGELILYTHALASSVRSHSPSTVNHFQRSSPLKPSGLSKPNFM